MNAKHFLDKNETFVPTQLQQKFYTVNLFNLIDHLLYFVVILRQQIVYCFRKS